MLQAYVDNFKTTFPYTAPPTDGQSAINMGMLIDGNNQAYFSPGFNRKMESRTCHEESFNTKRVSKR